MSLRQLIRKRNDKNQPAASSKKFYRRPVGPSRWRPTAKLLSKNKPTRHPKVIVTAMTSLQFLLCWSSVHVLDSALWSNRSQSTNPKFQVFISSNLPIIKQIIFLGIHWEWWNSVVFRLTNFRFPLVSFAHQQHSSRSLVSFCHDRWIFFGEIRNQNNH